MKSLWSNFASSWNGFRSRAARRARHQKELVHRQEFTEFYNSLQLDADPVYVFFTCGLLHWLTKAEQFVPPEVNLVLIGSGLTPQEVKHLREHVNRPTHVIRPRVDDATVWEWLFEVNRTNFGWLDVDCIVLNPRLFNEMRNLPDDVAMNGCWLNYQGWAFLATHFIHINQRAIAGVKATVPGVSPRNYFVLGEPELRMRVANLLSDTELALARQVGPLKRGFDTLQFYQLACLASGYKLGTIRKLNDDPMFSNFCSEELLHLGGASYYLRQFLSGKGPSNYSLILRAVVDYLLLDAAGPDLPQSYAALKDLLRRMLGDDPDVLRVHIYDFLLAKGFSEQAFSKPGLEFLRYASQRRHAVFHGR